jgi:hypothetical protein
MNLQERCEVLIRLGDYMRGDDEAWHATKDKGHRENAWFIPEFIEVAVHHIADRFLRPEELARFVTAYKLPAENASPKEVGLVLAGNIPLVGFHDIMCTFLSGHRARIKLSSKDDVLTRHVVEKLAEWSTGEPAALLMENLLKNCDAYIATGSNNTSRYFEHYFQKYAHIIRRNRTSVAILTGTETPGELEKLADDICQFFGLGCRNVTQLHVPKDYDFVPLLRALDKYDYFINHNKYKNNYDHNLSMHILNNQYYMTNGSVLLIENESPFAPISQVHYRFYNNKEEAEAALAGHADIQCVTGIGHTPFGNAQCPAVDTFADGVDTMAFLAAL